MVTKPFNWVLVPSRGGFVLSLNQVELLGFCRVWLKNQCLEAAMPAFGLCVSFVWMLVMFVPLLAMWRRLVSSLKLLMLM